MNTCPKVPLFKMKVLYAEAIKPRGTVAADLKVTSKHSHLHNLHYSLQFSASYIQKYIY